MRIVDDGCQVLIGPETDKLVLHLSEPNFTFWQRLSRRFRQFISHCQDRAHA